jgi:hypothetical protein
MNILFKKKNKIKNSPIFYPLALTQRVLLTVYRVPLRAIQCAEAEVKVTTVLGFKLDIIEGDGTNSSAFVVTYKNIK